MKLFRALERWHTFWFNLGYNLGRRPEATQEPKIPYAEQQLKRAITKEVRVEAPNIAAPAVAAALVTTTAIDCNPSDGTGTSYGMPSTESYTGGEDGRGDYSSEQGSGDYSSGQDGGGNGGYEGGYS